MSAEPGWAPPSKARTAAGWAVTLGRTPAHAGRKALVPLSVLGYQWAYGGFRCGEYGRSPNPALDGYGLAATVFEPRDGARDWVIVSGAFAVAARFYSRYAT